MAVLQDMSQGDLIAQIEAMRRENDRLKALAKGSGRFKIGEKGALSVYGLGRFPVTLYRSQWEALANLMPEIKEYIAANADRLTSKA